MILETPIQKDGLKLDHLIRSEYSDYEATFVILHPFLKIKLGQNIKFEADRWPTKKQIIEKTVPVSWIEIINQAQLKDIKELDKLLAFLHCASRTADKTGWIKFITVINKNNLLEAQVDNYPEILTDATLELLKCFGYTEIYHFSDTGSNKRLYNIQELIDRELRLPETHPRLLTPDNKILFATDFDQRFTYLSSDKKIIENIVMQLDLEGFYCDSTTKTFWSYEEQLDNIIDWKSEERYKNYA